MKGIKKVLIKRSQINTSIYHLEIDRGNGFIEQFCPFSSDRDRCGTWCPLFTFEIDAKSGIGSVSLCQQVYYDNVSIIIEGEMK